MYRTNVVLVCFEWIRFMKKGTPGNDAKLNTVKHICNDHLYSKIYYL